MLHYDYIDAAVVVATALQLSLPNYQIAKLPIAIAFAVAGGAVAVVASVAVVAVL